MPHILSATIINTLHILLIFAKISTFLQFLAIRYQLLINKIKNQNQNTFYNSSCISNIFFLCQSAHSSVSSLVYLGFSQHFIIFQQVILLSLQYFGRWQSSWFSANFVIREQKLSKFCDFDSILFLYVILIEILIYLTLYCLI